MTTNDELAALCLELSKRVATLEAHASAIDSSLSNSTELLGSLARDLAAFSKSVDDSNTRTERLITETESTRCEIAKQNAGMARVSKLLETLRSAIGNRATRRHGR